MRLPRTNLLTEEHEEILNAQMKQINSRLTIERLADKVPAIRELQNANKRLLSTIARALLTLVYRNELQLVLDENGLNKIGQTEQEALGEINRVLNEFVSINASLQS